MTGLNDDKNPKKEPKKDSFFAIIPDVVFDKMRHQIEAFDNNEISSNENQHGLTGDELLELSTRLKKK